MKILVYSPAFHPMVGGLEISTQLLCEELHRRGHAVTLVCRTPFKGEERFSFELVRQPSPWQLLRLVHWCDVFFQRNVSLKGLWPLLFFRRPWVVSHHGWYRLQRGKLGWRNRLKRFLLRFARNISISKAIADDLGVPSVVIPNPYRDDLFRLLPGVKRHRDLAFVGRLVSDKGVDLLLDALSHLRQEGVRPTLTVIGEGPDLEHLRARAQQCGLDHQVAFAGSLLGQELVKKLNEHRILVVPSRYREPFGNVALEGIACGCLVVGSQGGGLPEAIGPCGRTFPNGGVTELARILRELVGGETPLPLPPEGVVKEHLQRHCRERVASAYLEVIENAVPEPQEGTRPMETRI